MALSGSNCTLTLISLVWLAELTSNGLNIHSFIQSESFCEISVALCCDQINQVSFYLVDWNFNCVILPQVIIYDITMQRCMSFRLWHLNEINLAHHLVPLEINLVGFNCVRDQLGKVFLDKEN